MNKKRILIVEDEVLIGSKYEMMLKELGYEVAGICPTGEQAIEKALILKPDLVLMDIMLDGEKSGIETAQIIMDNLGIPVIYITAYANREIIEKAQETYPAGYILKPVRREQLHVSVVIGLAKSMQERRIKTEGLKYRSIVENGAVEMTLKYLPGNPQKAGFISECINADIEKSEEKLFQLEKDENRASGTAGPFEIISGNPDYFKPVYTIKEASGGCGVDRNVIRKYEREGLIRPFRDELNNNRFFTQDEIDWLSRVKKLIHKEGISIEGIRRLLSVKSCWDNLHCQAGDRSSCSFYTVRFSLCWAEDDYQKCCRQGRCFDCPHYIIARRSEQLSTE